MTLGKAVRSIAFGILFAVLALGLLPFLVVNSLGELYGAVESTEMVGIPLMYLFRKVKKDENDPSA